MISVITPVYNGEQHIEACINTVINQACGDVEHIIVDGGSTDRTVEIIQRYAENYAHIRWLSEPDQGQSDAMNKGIAIAHGEILAILNVDDYYEPQVLNRVAQLFQTLPTSTLLVGNCQVWDNFGNLIEVNRPANLGLFDLVSGVNIHPYPCNPSAYFYHAQLHEKIGLYRVDDHYAMDLDFILRAVQVANVVYVNETWGNYRRLEGTKTVTDMKNGHMDRRVLSLLKHYRQYLPWPQQVQLVARDRLATIQYFFSKPHEVPRAIKAKLVKAS